METPNSDAEHAVLVSGGLDSAIYLAEALTHYPSVHPLYVRFGLLWEETELVHLRKFLGHLRSASLKPLVVLDMPVRDVYGPHWSLTGQGVPEAGSADAEVFLPGRNLLFLAKALLWCHLHQIPTLALAPLAANPFPDATPAFFSGCEAVVNQAVGGQVQVLLPYRELSKASVLRRGRHLPLAHTFSCIQPRSGLHCGVCNKCHERRVAFREADLPDPTQYTF